MPLATTPTTLGGPSTSNDPILIRGGRLIDPSQGIDQVRDLKLLDGKIVEEFPAELQQKIVAQEMRLEEIDAQGLLVTPGLIDLHVHLREPGQTEKETIATGSAAAAAGGFTTIVGMPNTSPRIDTVERLEWVLAKAAQDSLVNFYSTAALSLEIAGKELTCLEELATAGAIALTDDGHCIQELAMMREAVMRTQPVGIPIMDHCQESSLTVGSIMNEGKWSQQLGLTGWPKLAEEVIVARNILLAEEYQQPIHCQHISSGRSIQLLREARRRGVPITAEASPHHLTLTDAGLANLNTNYKVNPPLRTEEDIEALLGGIADGTITILASDHAPHTEAEKERPIDQAPFGMIGLETELAVYLTKLYHQEKVTTLSELIAMLTLHPAQLLGMDLTQEATLRPGAKANITLIDPELEWTYHKENSVSKGRNTPFHHYHFRGRAVRTLVKGKTVWSLIRGF